jgi:hypothetical protein
MGAAIRNRIRNTKIAKKIRLFQNRPCKFLWFAEMVT